MIKPKESLSDCKFDIFSDGMLNILQILVQDICAYAFCLCNLCYNCQKLPKNISTTWMGERMLGNYRSSI